MQLLESLQYLLFNVKVSSGQETLVYIDELVEGIS
jgi:hypothetical protein